MIAVKDDCPGWIREFSRFLPLKNILFVYGNILDLISYPVKRSDSEEVYWTESDLPGFFERFLSGIQYEVMGFFDPVDGLKFSTPQMEDVYKRLQKGKPVDAPAPADSNPRQNETANKEQERQETVPARKWGAPPDPNHIMDGIRNSVMNRTTPCAFVFNLASRLVTSPSHIQKTEREMFTRILKASLSASEVIRGDVRWNNVLILVCDKLNDIPAFLYLNNPRARSIHIPKPDTIDRVRFIKRAYRAFYGTEQGQTEPPSEFASLFAALTEGLTNYEMKSLVSLSLKEKIPVKNIENICERYKYGITESEWDKIDKERLDKTESFIRTRIKGQDFAVASVLDIVKRAKIGLSAGTSHKGSRPRGVLFFAGPTGVGKTEMAKALAEHLFGNEDRCIRFDMSEYGAEHSDQKLMGAPPGYVGYEEGGQLTNAVKERPFSIILFDEIDKAHGNIFDKFLQILDDGRLTDGKGETVYFSESIIIFTSNLGVKEVLGLSGGDISKISYQQTKNTIHNAIRNKFNNELGRPEILNRFGDNFVIFDFIRPPLDEEIVDLMLSKLIEAAKEHKKIELLIDEPVKEKLILLARNKLHHGGRGIRNAIDSSLVNPLNRVLFDKGICAGAKVRVTSLIDHEETSSYRFELEVKQE